MLAGPGNLAGGYLVRRAQVRMTISGLHTHIVQEPDPGNLDATLERFDDHLNRSSDGIEPAHTEEIFSGIGNSLTVTSVMTPRPPLRSYEQPPEVIAGGRLRRPRDSVEVVLMNIENFGSFASPNWMCPSVEDPAPNGTPGTW